MGFSYEAPESVKRDGGDFIKAPGTFHVFVTTVDEQPTDSSGNLIEGFAVVVQVLEGTAKDANGKCTEVDRTSNIKLRNPKLTDKNEGLFHRKKQGRFFIAANLMSPDQLGGSIDIDLDKAVNAQMIMTFQDDEFEGKKRIKLNFQDIWHVDDPDAPKIPMDERSLNLLPKEHRKTPEYFGVEVSKATDKQAEKSQQETATATAATATADAGVDIDDI